VAWAVLAATLVGAALRLPLVGRFPLREDEAIYAYWALHGAHVDPLFLTVWPDKPPLFIWLLAAAFQLGGATPETARLVNVVLSAAAIPLVALAAYRWWGRAAAVAAAVALALNPFAISFGPTAYTDPLLVCAGAGAVALVAWRRFFWAGVLLGAAIMTKQQGLLFIPLLAALGGWELRHAGGKAILRDAGLLVAGVLLVAGPILVWDSLRWAVAPSPWDLGARNVGGVALAEPALWLARGQAWLALAGYLVASRWLTMALLVVGGGLVVSLFLLPAPQPRRYVPALILAAWGIGFLALHGITTVQVWDRYLLPLVLPLALVIGAGAGRVGEVAAELAPSTASTRRMAFPAATWLAAPALLVLLLTLSPAMAAADGRLPIGGDHGDYAGLEEASAWVRHAAPEGAASGATPGVVLYHHALGWQHEFYLFDAVQRGTIELRWYPSAVYLADNATKTAHKRRFVIVPDWVSARELDLQLAARRLAAHQALRSGHFTVYEIAELSGGDASWRACWRPAPAPWPGAGAAGPACR
jgi:4-amino-4-deoxy-L-arabinose transferase-like glycosyltransferase